MLPELPKVPPKDPFPEPPVPLPEPVPPERNGSWVLPEAGAAEGLGEPVLHAGVADADARGQEDGRGTADDQRVAQAVVGLGGRGGATRARRVPARGGGRGRRSGEPGATVRVPGTSAVTGGRPGAVRRVGAR